MNRRLITSILFLMSCFIKAQSILLPYLSNGLYGLADESGKIIIPVQYQDIVLYPKNGLMAVKKDGLWGVLNTQGKECLKPTLTTCEIHLSQIQYVGTEVFLNSRLSTVSDKSKALVYYVNGFAPKKDYSPFYNSDNPGSRFTGFVGAPTGLTHTVVGVPGKKVNVIDSTGQKILATDVDHAFFVTKDIMAIDTGSGLYALFTIQHKQLTDYVCKYFTPSPRSNYTILGTKPISKGETQYQLIGPDGKVIFGNKTYITAIDDQLLIANDSLQGSIYSYSGQRIASYPGRRVKKLWQSDTTYFLLEHPSRYVGIIDRHGKLVVDTTTYSSISGAVDKHYYFKRGHAGGRMNSQFKEVWSIDSVSVTALERTRERFIIENQSGPYGSYRRGVADSLGHIIVQPIYKMVEIFEQDSVLLIKSDNQAGVLDWNGKEIIPLTSKTINVQLRYNGRIMLMHHDSAWAYDRYGKLMKMAPVEKSIGYANLDNEPAVLLDKNGNEIPKSNYRQIFSNPDEKAKQLVYFGRPKEERAQFNHIFNSKGTNITPEGYGLPERITSMYTGTNGAIIVVHMQDAIQQKMPPRIGVINFNGEWVVEPDYHMISLVGNELIQVKNYTTGKTTVYNRYGQVIIKKEYHILDNDRRDHILHDRILVGYIDDFEQYVKRLEDAVSETDPALSDSKMNSIKDPKGRRGFIDTNGNEVIEVKYTYADLFKYAYTSVSGVDGKGNVFSNIIDVNGKTLLSTPYERLAIQDADSTLVAFKNNGRWGMMDLKGNVLIEAKYQEITVDWEGPVIAGDSLYGYVIINNNVTRIDHFGYADIEELGADLLHIRIAEREKSGHQSYHYLFDRKGTYFGDFTPHLPTANATVSIVNLPPGYVRITPGFKKPYYLVQLNTGKAFKEE